MSQSSAALQLRYLQVKIISSITIWIIIIIINHIINSYTLTHYSNVSDAEQHQRGEELDNHIPSSHRPGQKRCWVRMFKQKHHSNDCQQSKSLWQSCWVKMFKHHEKYHSDNRQQCHHDRLKVSFFVFLDFITSYYSIMKTFLLFVV